METHLLPDDSSLPAKPRVLVIEDDGVQQRLLSEVVSLIGSEAECANSCASARALFAKGRYGCALIDLGLPDGTGMSLLGDFTQTDPAIVCIILTADSAADTVINTMRAGAFDYVVKPFEIPALQAVISRALSHHALLRERAELFRLLLEEREQLRARVEAATSDIRQYARACEVSNARLRVLLELAQFPPGFSSEEGLLQNMLGHLVKHIPLRSLTVCDTARRRLAAVIAADTASVPRSPQDKAPGSYFASTEGPVGQTTYDDLLAVAEPEQFITAWLERHAQVDTKSLKRFVFPQTFGRGSSYAVGFFLDAVFSGDAPDREFLEMCARYLAFEMERGRLLLHVAHQASLGNIAGELVRNFVQPLTAIRTAADFVKEAIVTPDIAPALDIISENVERLRSQVQEFRKLSVLREDAIETVRLDEYVDRAVEMLSVTIQSRRVRIVKNYCADCECVLLNGTVLARTFLDLILSALRAVEINGRVSLRLRHIPSDRIAFELVYRGAAEIMDYEPTLEIIAPARTGRLHATPAFQLAERAVHSCGGTLAVETAENLHTIVRVLLPRNAASLNQAEPTHSPASASGRGTVQ